MIPHITEGIHAYDRRKYLKAPEGKLRISSSGKSTAFYHNRSRCRPEWEKRPSGLQKIEKLQARMGKTCFGLQHPVSTLV
jgi:hypothetical protein